MELFDFDLGHNPRSASTPSTADDAKLTAAQNAWFAYYVKGEGSEPAGAHGGVTAITSVLPGRQPRTSGTEYKAAELGEPRTGRNPPRRRGRTDDRRPRAPRRKRRSPPATSARRKPPAKTPRRRRTSSPAAPSEGFTIAGASTVIGEFSTPGTNDQVIARLMDVNEAEGGTQQLIGRAIYRPINPGGGFTKQVFQLHPQAWKVAAGHVLKLQLLVQDSTYARSSSSPQSIQVKNLELRVPTIETPGSDGGLVQTPLPKYLPPGYTLARNVTPAAPGAPHVSERRQPERERRLHARLGSRPRQRPRSTYTLQHKNAERRLEHRRERPHESRIRVHARAAPRRKARGPTG